MANTALEHTTVSAGNRGVWTFSFWLKRSNTEDAQSFYSEKSDSNDFFSISFTSGDQLEIQNKDNGSNNLVYISTRVFKDLSAWYHIVFAYDSAQSSASDRFRVWVNGVAETAWDASTLPAQGNTDIAVSKGSSGTYNPRVGKYDASTYYNGYMAQVLKVDGQSLAASNFGSTDATTGEWKPKSDGEVRTAVTAGSGWGTTGWMLTFQNSSYPGYDYKTSDRSSNLDFTVGGDGFQSQTTPSNIFATGVSDFKYVSNFTWSAGNTTFINTGSWEAGYWNMAPTTGKWYFEAKLIAIGSGAMFGIASIDEVAQEYGNTGFNVGEGTYQYAYNGNGNKKSADSETAFGNTYTTGDILGCAMDLDNGKIYFAKNGTWENSGDPTSGATGTGAAYSLTTGADYPYAPSFATYGSGQWGVNTGEGYFGTTAVTSSNADDAGLGLMEYDVPTGYYTLCTKNIKTYG